MDCAGSLNTIVSGWWWSLASWKGCGPSLSSLISQSIFFFFNLQSPFQSVRFKSFNCGVIENMLRSLHAKLNDVGLLLSQAFASAHAPSRSRSRSRSLQWQHKPACVGVDNNPFVFTSMHLYGVGRVDDGGTGKFSSL